MPQKIRVKIKFLEAAPSCYFINFVIIDPLILEEG